MVLAVSVAGDDGCCVFGDASGFCCGVGGDFSADTAVWPEAKARGGGAVSIVHGGISVGVVGSALSSAAAGVATRVVVSAVFSGGDDNISSATPGLMVSLLLLPLSSGLPLTLDSDEGAVAATIAFRRFRIPDGVATLSTLGSRSAAMASMAEPVLLPLTSRLDWRAVAVLVVDEGARLFWT